MHPKSSAPSQLSRVSGNGGLIVTPSPVANRHRDLIATLAARHRLPAVYGSRPYVAAGGLISYGPDMIDQYRRAAGYVGRILRGEKPAGPAADQVRPSDQPQDRQGARARDSRAGARGGV
jgi:ABC-type uncharacterized transport system substrate-binding protein